MPMPSKLSPMKICERCGISFSRKKLKSGRLEDLRAYLPRRFCSRTCGNSRLIVKPDTFYWRARHHRKSACEACSATTLLTVHHVDQHAENNEPQNLQTLCKRCHDFWHAVARRRGWNFAGRMPILDWGGRTASGSQELQPTLATERALALSATRSSRSAAKSSATSSGNSQESNEEA